MPNLGDVRTLRVRPCVDAEDEGSADIDVVSDPASSDPSDLFGIEVRIEPDDFWRVSDERCREGVRVEFAREDDRTQTATGSVFIELYADEPRLCRVEVEREDPT